MAEGKPEHDWLAHLRPTGLVVSTLVLDEQGLVAEPQNAAANAQIAALLGLDEQNDSTGALLSDPWALLRDVLGWPASMVAGLPGGELIPTELIHLLADHETLLEPTYALKGPRGEGWQLLVRVEEHGVDPEKRGALSGWEATPHQRFERLLRETGIGAGLLVTRRIVGELEQAELRLIAAPRGETSGWIAWPLRPLASVAGRPMLGGLKLLLGSFRLFNAPEGARLPALLTASRERQDKVSEKLAQQVLTALYELLRGFDAAEPALIRELAQRDPHALYEGLLTVLMRLVFVLYAEDRDLLPSERGHGGLELYERGYSLRGLFAQLETDAALNPDTMDERRGAWGRLLALFRLIDRGHSRFMQARGGKLFSEASFPFLLGKADASYPDRVPPVSDGCIHRILASLMVVGGERLSYRTLDVEQIGSVYETVMGFTAQLAAGRSIAIKAGKNNRTPVYVDCAALAGVAGKEREKALKDLTGRGQLPAAVKRDLKDADDAAALEAALSAIADERGSPRSAGVPAGTPILQPTGERRRTGSHYTPRSLTEPIVRHALQPGFARLGAEATPEEVLSLRVCDPACGSGAFLVEATRQIGTRLAAAWEAHPALKPPIPADEDDDLHARRLVAQRCIYGVDRNPMATDLAKLSLWLATLARDHEFSFLDHALKSGDSLVGLTRRQIEGATWEANPQPNLWRLRVAQDVESALTQREAIRTAPDDVALAMQEARHVQVERGLERVRLIGNAAVAVFFAHDKDRARRAALPELSLAAGGEAWERLRNTAVRLEGGEHPVKPFHWEIEFPEVFQRDNPGFDAIVGNPPFLGGTRISMELSRTYLEFLWEMYGGGGRTDLIAYFFLRAFALLREGGVFGLVASNTISQGETRAAGLGKITKLGKILRAIRRLSWPGEAAVVVSVIHVGKAVSSLPELDGQVVDRITSYLFSDGTDDDPLALHSNRQKAFEGMVPYGDGFMRVGQELSDRIEAAEWIFPYARGKDVASSPTPVAKDKIVYFGDKPLTAITDDVLVDRLEAEVREDRQTRSAEVAAADWWTFWRPRMRLWSHMQRVNTVLLRVRVASHHAFERYPTPLVPDTSLVVIPDDSFGTFATLQSRSHEVWTRFFASTLEDRLRYTPSDCFETFPLPPGFDCTPVLEAAGAAYHAHRATMMAATNKGMTPTYNRFHDPADTKADIVTLRTLHAAMDDAVLRAYGWDDLADRAAGPEAPRHLTEDDEDDHKYQKRLFWPAPFRDELLARLLRENERRAAAEREGN